MQIHNFFYIKLLQKYSKNINATVSQDKDSGLCLVGQSVFWAYHRGESGLYLVGLSVCWAYHRGDSGL